MPPKVARIFIYIRNYACISNSQKLSNLEMTLKIVIVKAFITVMYILINRSMIGKIRERKS